MQSLIADTIFNLPETDAKDECWDGYGVVFINGPWDKCGWWCEKAGNEGDEVILLIPARMNNAWMHNYVRPADAHYIPSRRVIFENAPQTTPPFHVMLVYWGTHEELFKKCYLERDWWFL